MDYETKFMGIKKSCRLRGVNLTPKKALIASHLAMESDFVHAEDLYFKIRATHAGFSMTTVYYTLRWLHYNGIAERIVHQGQMNQYRLNIEGMILRH